MPNTLDEINRLPPAGFVAALGSLFEHSPWVAEGAAARGPFRDLAHLQAELAASMRRAPAHRQLELIRAHPDLAGRLAQVGRLTAASTREQASAGLDRMSPEDLAEFQRLNAAYLEKFGFPFVICARLSNRAAIREAMQRRLGNSPAGEKEAALAEIEKIAWLRLQDAVKK